MVVHKGAISSRVSDATNRDDVVSVYMLILWRSDSEFGSDVRSTSFRRCELPSATFHHLVCKLLETTTPFISFTISYLLSVTTTHHYLLLPDQQPPAPLSIHTRQPGLLFSFHILQAFVFLNKRCEAAFLVKSNPRKTSWTQVYRRLHKKGTEVEIAKRRARRAKRVQVRCCGIC